MQDALSAMRAMVFVGVVLVATIVAGCGEEDSAAETDRSQLAVPWVDPDGDPPIIGSLSVNPADSTLFMGTNTGLFRIADGSSEPEQITGRVRTPDGDGEVSAALVAEFTGPDVLIASGHPAAGSILPPALGLIRSEDAGKTWTPVSELGRADFHTLELSEGRIVAALYQQPQILVSDDDGKTWQTRAAPLALTALEVDPADADRWIASTERGTFMSTDAGETWRQRDPTPHARFAWQESGDLFRVDPGGPVRISGDRGESWEDRGSTGGEPQALEVDDSGTLYAALRDGTLKVSSDGGQTFTDRLQGG
jgi:hypothetical protein